MAQPELPAQVTPHLPRSVRMLDLLGGVLLLLAFIIAVGGGVRFHVGGLRVSLLSWPMPATTGLVILIARHLWWPRPSVLSRVAHLYRRLLSSADWQESWGIFVATRVSVLAVGLLAVNTIG